MGGNKIWKTNTFKRKLKTKQETNQSNLIPIIYQPKNLLIRNSNNNNSLKSPNKKNIVTISKNGSIKKKTSKNNRMHSSNQIPISKIYLTIKSQIMTIRTTNNRMNKIGISMIMEQKIINSKLSIRTHQNTTVGLSL